MKRKKLFQLTAAVMAVLILSPACTSVKSYQKNKINDGEMKLSARKSEKPESNFQSYREGASGANGGKVGGGCGCN
jgi:outer membrane protein assembly factor BamE (lipoprotein component of BamABCDE complex)